NVTASITIKARSDAEWRWHCNTTRSVTLLVQQEIGRQVVFLRLAGLAGYGPPQQIGDRHFGQLPLHGGFGVLVNVLQGRLDPLADHATLIGRTVMKLEERRLHHGSIDVQQGDLPGMPCEPPARGRSAVLNGNES